MSLFRLLILLFAAVAAGPVSGQAFPGATGWAAASPGGRGGAVVRVTNLNPAGPGSLRAALERSGPRIVVFEVGGVIDLGLTTLTIDEPFLTIAGQTAPSPGITLIRGGIDIRAHDVIVRHIRIRPGVSGQGPRSGWEVDGLSTVGAWNVIIARSPGRSTRISPPRGPDSPARRRRNGGAAPATTSPSPTISSPKASPMPAIPRASIRRAR
jgi:hypothetical protein